MKTYGQELKDLLDSINTNYNSETEANTIMNNIINDVIENIWGKDTQETELKTEQEEHGWDKSSGTSSPNSQKEDTKEDTKEDAKEYEEIGDGVRVHNHVVSIEVPGINQSEDMFINIGEKNITISGKSLYDGNKVKKVIAVSKDILKDRDMKEIRYISGIILITLEKKEKQRFFRF